MPGYCRSPHVINVPPASTTPDLSHVAAVPSLAARELRGMAARPPGTAPYHRRLQHREPHAARALFRRWYPPSLKIYVELLINFLVIIGGLHSVRELEGSQKSSASPRSHCPVLSNNPIPSRQPAATVMRPTRRGVAP